MHTKSPHICSGKVPADCWFVCPYWAGDQPKQGWVPQPTTQKGFSTWTISVTAEYNKHLSTLLLQATPGQCDWTPFHRMGKILRVEKKRYKGLCNCLLCQVIYFPSSNNISKLIITLLIITKAQSNMVQLQSWKRPTKFPAAVKGTLHSCSSLY